MKLLITALFAASTMFTASAAFACDGDEKKEETHQTDHAHHDSDDDAKGKTCNKEKGAECDCKKNKEKEPTA